MFSSASSSSYSSASDAEQDDGMKTPSSSTSDLEEPSSPSRFLFARHVGPPPPRRRKRKSGGANQKDSTEESQTRSPGEDDDERGRDAGSKITELPDSSSEADKPKVVEGGSGDVTEETNSTPGELEEIEFEGAGPRANGLLRRMYGVGRASDEDGVYEVTEESEGERIAVAGLDSSEGNPQEEDEAVPRKLRARSLSDATLKSQEATDHDGAESVKEKKRREKKEEEAEDAANADDESVLKRDRSVPFSCDRSKLPRL